ncbi:TRAP transporter permease [Rossellomorea marisflavi]|uniref:C4-dicarboxylate ABC transporter n=1 Tax=Rossellomorea marisflavi TaxID=189381 RepID=A0A0J5SNR3_9BACI|nr:TRAP transporter permease [Rossellomorea marisflavi]KMK96747.1 C4-dicarboxylate ABC transporter [Rossellomorea marisflavi]KML06212.1 C4-dicarboxylate ABC transporter [Rossellomorea marisflavi]KZE49577.1 C4-dicarboxylate ABC transporter [Rossellomorea marisflavi]MCM2603752.1 TRAP transporter permease [Rossellomorea marisflavi]USK93844.1 TRAP transporter permease [Rossellomorea marisflavi]
MEKDEKFETLTEEQQRELLEKYDPESSTRKLESGFFKWVIFYGLLAFSLFQLVASIFQFIPRQLLLSIHLGFALSLVFLLFPARKKNLKKKKVAWYDVILSVISIGIGAYWPLMQDDIVSRVGMMTSLDFYVGFAAMILVLEATRRAVGLPITIIATLFILYMYYGRLMPGFLAHRGFDWDDIVKTMFFTSEGILGTPLYVSATFIFLFLLFGAFLVKTGVGQYFNDLAVAIAGKRIGGPAKVAIFSSALQGTISGSSVANVVTSGSFTIPMMKKLGYRKEFAGGVEAAASTGGQLMPPVMGAAAFLMVEFIGGISYWDIAKAAAIPAVLYFTGIWIMTHFEAKRVGLRGLSDEEMPDKKEVFKQIYLLLPILTVIILLVSGMSVMRAALWSIVATVVISGIRKATRIGFRDAIDALVDGARTALSVAVATACAGMIVGVVTKTGLGLTMANGLVDLAADLTNTTQGKLILTLVFTMIASLILGMGSPTTANYVITSTIAAPAIILLGAPELSAHLFVFYFGIVADITPPVALAAFAAAGVSGGEPIKTGVNAAKLAIAAFIIPYMFVLSPELLMIDTTIPELLWVVFTAITGMIAIGAGIIGYWFRRMYAIERLFAVAAGLMLIYPEGMSDMIGLITFIVLIGLQFFVKREDKVLKATA